MMRAATTKRKFKRLYWWDGLSGLLGDLKVRADALEAAIDRAPNVKPVEAHEALSK